MYVSRLTFHTLPGKTHHVEQELMHLQNLVRRLCGVEARVLRAHYASLGSADVVFEQEAPDLATLEHEIQQVKDSPEFQRWTGSMTGFLAETPKREIYCVVHAAAPAADTAGTAAAMPAREPSLTGAGAGRPATPPDA